MNNSQFLTLGEAARQFQIDKGTLSRDRAKGKFSAEKKEGGAYRVAVSELMRAYGDRLKHREVATVGGNGRLQQLSTPVATPTTAVLEAKLEAAERMLRDRDGTIDDLRERLTKADEERTRLTTLLTDQRQKPAEPERRGWRLFGIEIKRAD